MKEKRIHQIIASIILIVIDIGLFILLVDVLRGGFIDIVGYDIADYQNMGRVYRFGAGCSEYLFVIVKAVLLIFLERKIYTKYKESKVLFIIAIIIHIILFLLCIVYVYKFLEGYNIFWLLRYFLTGAEPPF